MQPRRTTDCFVSRPTYSDSAIRDLRQKLDAFYATTKTYIAFDEGTLHEEWFALLRPHLLDQLERKPQIRLLEVGAGKSTFSRPLAEVRDRVEYHVQDITPQNREYLETVCDRALIGDLSSIEGQYDVIYHTFVLEHVCAPETFLANVERLLAPGGLHVVICPRYDLPGYLCPSLRHLGAFQRLAVRVRLALSRACAAVDGRVRFLVNTNPAVFHQPFFRDSDAVHLVSGLDVRRWHNRRGYKVQSLIPKSYGLKDAIVKRFALLAIVCERPV
jgi:SAM-dependent methyltransferase